uniref:Integrase catalytic domain-containing protein n=1 Tax=Glossina austeni TaxID=7395 RepID=A0A1A9UR48_GLOAU
MVKLEDLTAEQLKHQLRERNVAETGGKRNKKEMLERRLWEQLRANSSVFEVYPTGNIVEEDKCTAAEKREARTYVAGMVTRFGIPTELHSYQGRNFESLILQEVRQMFGIDKTKKIQLHPQSDEIVERFNRTHQGHLRKVIDDNQQHWDERVPIFLMAYRSPVHNATTVSPAMILFGSNLRLPAELKFWTPLMSKGSTPNILLD